MIFKAVCIIIFEYIIYFLFEKTLGEFINKSNVNEGGAMYRFREGYYADVRRERRVTTNITFKNGVLAENRERGPRDFYTPPLL